jgi:hypothetical protein
MPRLERALLALIVALSVTFVVLVCYRPTGTVDMWWTLAVGEYILSEGDVPRTALWTIDALRDLPYVCHGWLGALVYGAVASALGLDAVPLVPTFIALAVFGSLVGVARQLGAPWSLAVTAPVLVLHPLMLRMICRVEVFGYLYFALTLQLIATYTRTQRARHLVWLVPLFVLWVNSHGSFPIVLAVLPLVAAGLSLDAWRRTSFRRDALAASLFSRSSAALFAIWLVLAAATLLNPYGGELVRSILEPSQEGSMTRFIAEWRPPYASGSLPARFLMPAGLATAVLLVGFRRLSFVSALLVGFLAALALSASRHITFFAIGTTFLLGDFAAGLSLPHRCRMGFAAVLAVLLLAANAYAVHALGLADRSLARNPSPWVTARGLEFILGHVRGNVLNEYHLGGLLIYFGHPQIRVSIDSRAGPYPPSYFQLYRNAIFGREDVARYFVERYEIDHIILDRATYANRFRSKLRGPNGFQLVYADERTAVLSRAAPEAETSR